MKKLILAVTITAFTIGAFAGENCCPKDKAAAAAKDKSAACCAEKSACTDKSAAANKATCPIAAKAAKDAAAKYKVQSPRGAEASKS